MRILTDKVDGESPACFDLFCGIGGLTIGLEKAGIRTIGGVDSWEEAKTTFDSNLAPLRCMAADVTRVGVHQLEQFFGVQACEIDIVAGGPPCQGFSTVGKRDATDPRNFLWTAFRDLVAAVRPAYLIIENVEGLLVMEKGRVRDAILESFAEIGYRMDYRLLPRPTTAFLS